MTDTQIKDHLNRMAFTFLDMMPAAVRDKVYKSMFFAGGCVVDSVRDEVPQDYDIFFKDQETADAVHAYFKEIGAKAVTTNAVTVLDSAGVAYQAVTRFTGPLDRVFKDFDFEHCKSYFDLDSQALVYNRDIILGKKLVYTGEKDKYTLNTLKRLVKFTNRGWLVDNQSLIALHKAIHKNDITDPKVMLELAPGFYGSSFV